MDECTSDLLDLLQLAEIMALCFASIMNWSCYLLYKLYFSIFYDFEKFKKNVSLEIFELNLKTGASPLPTILDR